MKIGRWLLLAIFVAGAGYFALTVYQGRAGLPFVEELGQGTERIVPPGIRIKVEVLNATKVRGLARRATMYLRDRGFDVVDMGTSTEQHSKTLVLDRSNHPEWAKLVGAALSAKVETRPDSTRYLDVTVLLGDDWRPPALPFYP